MRGFKLDEKGDICIKNGQIEMVEGAELLRQKIQTVTGTNKGEWFANLEEGITFANVLGKNVQEDIVKNEVQQALTQVDETLYLKSYSYRTEGRNSYVSYVASNDQGEEIGGEIEWL